MPRLRRLDVSARTGLLLGAAAAGASYQPLLLSRGTRDQAIITGAAAASGYGWGSAAHSFLRTLADRFPAAGRSTAGHVITGLGVDATALGIGSVVATAIPPREHESPRRALVRLGAQGLAAAGAAGLVSGALDPLEGRRARGATLGTALVVCAASYLATRPRRTRTGASTVPGAMPGEDVARSVSPPQAIAMGAGVTVALLGLARGESALSTAFARGAAVVLGGAPGDHRALGRLGALAASGALGWTTVSAVVTKLSSAGSGMEVAHAEAPDLPEVTGSPASGIPWSAQSREGRRWLSMVLRADHIAAVMGEPARQPIRVYASLESAPTPQERAELLLREIDRTGALQRSVFALFSPTGSGYVNYVADETLEYLTRGDCASAAIEYSVLPSSLSLTKVPLGTHQTRMVVDGIVQRLLAMPAEQRPRFVLFGESLGSQVSQEMFSGAGSGAPDGIGLDAAVWIGTPAATTWRQQLWGTRSIATAPQVGPGAVYLPRNMPDWHDLPAEERAGVRFLLLQNGDDPVPKFDTRLLWRPPDWLGADHSRPIGAPRGTRWLPVTTFMAAFMDLLNALVPTPGDFREGGHDYRVEIPEALRQIWGLSATDEQMVRVQRVLRERELGWEVLRQWDEAQAAPEEKRAAALAKVEHEVAAWTGTDGPVGPDQVQALIDADTQPED